MSLRWTSLRWHVGLYVAAHAGLVASAAGSCLAKWAVVSCSLCLFRLHKDGRIGSGADFYVRFRLQGGGLYLKDSSSATITSSIISGNTAVSFDGDAWCVCIILFLH